MSATIDAPLESLGFGSGESRAKNQRLLSGIPHQAFIGFFLAGVSPFPAVDNTNLIHERNTSTL